MKSAHSGRAPVARVVNPTRDARAALDAGRALKASGVRRRHVVNEVAEVNALVWSVRVGLEADQVVPVVVDLLEHVAVGGDEQPVVERVWRVALGALTHGLSRRRRG